MIQTRARQTNPTPRGWRRRLRRWAEEFDPWAPRPGDYVVASVVFLGMALLYVGERSYAVQLNRRVFQLEERVGTLSTEVDVLVAEAVALADRGRIITRARAELGMIVPSAGDIEYVYFVSGQATRDTDDDSSWPAASRAVR